MDDDNIIVLALDPGGTTGACMLRWDGDNRHIPEPPALVLYDEVEFDNMPDWLDAAIANHRPDIIVYERYNISARTIQYTRQPEALYVIGGVIFMAKLAGIPTREQGSDGAKTAYPNERIKGWPVKGKHAKDALRHALISCHRRL